MIDRYRSEIEAPLNIQRGAKGIGVQRVQEWLGLKGHGVEIDGDFGPATEAALIAYQGEVWNKTSPKFGTLDVPTWKNLANDLISAGAFVTPGPTFGATVVAVAQAHLAAKAREIGGDNCGPWVRHYCRGQSVAWCQGFASTMWNDAAQLVGKGPALDLVIEGIWCLFVPTVAAAAKRAGLFMPGSAAWSPPPGSMFLLRGGAYGYLHVGIVEWADRDIMRTIEGNTNENGGANGYEVARRTRMVASCDFVRSD